MRFRFIFCAVLWLATWPASINPQQPENKCTLSLMVRAMWIADSLLSQPAPVPTPAPTPVFVPPGAKTRTRALTHDEFVTLQAFCNQWRDPHNRDFEECVIYPAALTLPAIVLEHRGAPAFAAIDTNSQWRTACWGPRERAPLVATAPRPSVTPAAPTRTNRQALLDEFAAISQICGTAHSPKNQ